MYPSSWDCMLISDSHSVFDTCLERNSSIETEWVVYMQGVSAAGIYNYSMQRDLTNERQGCWG